MPGPRGSAPALLPALSISGEAIWRRGPPADPTPTQTGFHPSVLAGPLCRLTNERAFTRTQDRVFDTRVTHSRARGGLAGASGQNVRPRSPKGACAPPLSAAGAPGWLPPPHRALDGELTLPTPLHQRAGWHVDRFLNSFCSALD